MDRRSHRRGMLVCFALALALRLLYLNGLLPPLESRQTPIYGDATMYWASAATQSGEPVAPSTVSGLQREDLARWDRHLTWSFMQERGPAYVLLLAGCFDLFGDSPWAVRYLQALLGAATCALVFLLGRGVAGAGAGWIAGLLCAAHPSLILFTGQILSETFSTFLLVLGLCALVRARRDHPLGWLVVSGLATAGGALARAWLLPVVPFVFASAVVSGPRRLRDLGALAAALFGPLLLWHAIASSAGGVPVAGGSGFRMLAAMAETATLPQYRGWRTDDFPMADLLLDARAGGWPEVLADDPFYPVSAAANLVFVQQWFLDNLWREVPRWLHAFQRAAFVLALGGFGVALLRWRDLSPLLLLCVPLAVASVTWIEIRHNVPFVPILAVLAGLFLSWLFDLAGRARAPRRAALSIAAALAASAAALALTRLPVAAALLQAASPFALGLLGDVAIVLVAAGWGGLVFALARAPLGRGRAAVAAGVPSGLFVALFASYAFIGSLSRWSAFEIDLAAPGRELFQTIELGRPLAADEIERVLWIVDLATDAPSPPLAVALDGEPLGSDQYAWRRLFCARRVAAETRQEAVRRESYCDVYVRGLSPFTGAYATAPQWWGIEMDPDRIAGREALALRLTPTRRTEPGAELELVVGAAISRDGPERYDGPSLDALDSGAATSLYRWHVTGDWRMWRAGRLASRRTEGRLATAAAGEPVFERRLASWLEDGSLAANVRLMVRQRGRGWVVY